MELPTVRIVNKDAKSGFTIINQSDFDPAKHTLVDGQSIPSAGLVGDKGPEVHLPTGEALKALRAEYEAKFGKRPFMGWDAEALTKKLAE